MKLKSIRSIPHRGGLAITKNTGLEACQGEPAENTFDA